MNGAVLYHGPSLLTGEPIVAIVTGLASGSANAKTGAMLQTWIMPADREPHVAVREGSDASVCGSCPHRPSAGGACYVVVAHAPLAVWRVWRRGSYGDRRALAEIVDLGAGRRVRLGSWGDPAAVPVGTWQHLLARAEGWTGYTHVWREPVAQALSAFCMASVDSPEEAREATATGWRYFRVRPHDDAGAPLANEIVCPAADEAGKKTTCERCRLCSGQTARAGRNVVIRAHGVRKKKARVQ